jgi:transcriptional regulator
MYVPSAFRIDDPAVIHGIVRRYPFALLTSMLEGEPIATHLPILLHREGDQDVLFGHVAKASPHWRAFGQKALIVFSGPHGYVSPSWYVAERSVPTWNYVSVHAHGTTELVEGEAVVEHLLELVNTFDPGLFESHPGSVDRDYIRAQMAGLVAFRMPVGRWDAKAKLNQNRSEADRLAVRARYLESNDPDERAMAEFMG